MYKIKGIYIYPIKGLGRIELDEAYVQTEGLQYDRRWMIIRKQDNSFISQRTHHHMTLFSVSISSDGFVTILYQKDEIKFHVNEYIDRNYYNAEVWGDIVKSVEVSKSVSSWLSKRLGVDCLLVKMADDSTRLKNLKFSNSFTKVSYADGYPILVLGTASIDELNKKCPIEISDKRFRANILLNTNVPHEEDDLMTLKINNVIIQTVKPCIRCSVVQIDPDNGLFGKEPLHTLSTYRKFDNEIRFGSNAIVLEEGRIKIGQILIKSQL